MDGARLVEGHLVGRYDLGEYRRQPTGEDFGEKLREIMVQTNGVIVFCFLCSWLLLHEGDEGLVEQIEIIAGQATKIGDCCCDVVFNDTPTLLVEDGNESIRA